MALSGKLTKKLVESLGAGRGGIAMAAGFILLWTQAGRGGGLFE